MRAAVMSRKSGGFKSGVKRKKLEINIEHQRTMADQAGFELAIRSKNLWLENSAEFRARIVKFDSREKVSHPACLSFTCLSERMV